MAVAASQMRAVLSSDAVTMRDPSGLKAAEFTEPSWPPRAKRQFACETAAASAAAAGEALIAPEGNARSMRVPCDANLSALSNSPRDSLGSGKLSENVGLCVVELDLASVKRGLQLGAARLLRRKLRFPSLPAAASESIRQHPR